MYKKGEFIYGYEIIEPLGSGAICQTYKAIGPNGKFVTMKFPSLAMVGDASTYERFLREAKIGKQLVHPAIPRTIALFENCEAPCLVLEYIEGQTLRSILADHAPFSLEEASWIIRKLASALTYLHNHGVYHRDLKPENVLLDSTGRVHIIDFGIALLEERAVSPGEIFRMYWEPPIIFLRNKSRENAAMPVQTSIHSVLCFTK